MNNNTSTGNQSTNSSAETESEGAPLWNYVTKLEKVGSGGTWMFTCHFCNETRQGSYFRIRAHLLGITRTRITTCKKVTMSERVEFKKLDDTFEKKKKESGRKEVFLPYENDASFKKRKSCFSPLEISFNTAARDHLDQEIARMFFTGGLAFNLARNPHYHRSYQFAAANKLDGYVPPGYNKLRTTLLQKERSHVEKLLVPLKSTSRAQDLVYIHNNLRLLSRNTGEYDDEKTKKWDVGGDEFDSMDDMGYLEFTELSLDDPEFENEFGH